MEGSRRHDKGWEGYKDMKGMKRLRRQDKGWEYYENRTRKGGL